MLDRDAIRQAYARSLMLGIRAGGHAVNCREVSAAVEYEELSWQGFAVAKAFRAVLADLEIPAPVTLAEVEACAVIEDTMCGSEPALLNRDIAVIRQETVTAVMAALAQIVDRDDLLSLISDFPIARLVEDTPWAA